MAAAFDPSEGLEVLFRDEDNVIARHGDLAVQVRTGALTAGALERIGSLGRLLVRRTEGPIAAVSVIEPTAESNEDAVRARQRETIRELTAAPHARVVVVIAGGGVMASLQRTVARMMAPGRAAVVLDAAAAARDLAEHLERPPAELEAVIEHVRAMARGDVAG